MFSIFFSIKTRCDNSVPLQNISKVKFYFILTLENPNLLVKTHLSKGTDLPLTYCTHLLVYSSDSRYSDCRDLRGLKARHRCFNKTEMKRKKTGLSSKRKFVSKRKLIRLSEQQIQELLFRVLKGRGRASFWQFRQLPKNLKVD